MIKVIKSYLKFLLWFKKFINHAKGDAFQFKLIQCRFAEVISRE